MSADVVELDDFRPTTILSKTVGGFTDAYVMSDADLRRIIRGDLGVEGICSEMLSLILIDWAERVAEEMPR